MPDQQIVAVGARVRELRRERGLSLSALAREAGIGKGSLSELETGHRNPTLATLYAVAAPLRVSLGALLDFRVGAAVADGGFEATLLHAERGPSAVSETFLLGAAPGTTRSSPAHGPGVSEQLVVLEGSCRVRWGAPGQEQEQVVAAGGHLAWPGDVPHGYDVVGETELRAIDVVRTPITD
ncbi:helix-turn-helix domain-containing protein [Nocardioides sp. zg-DK7169]|uniref:helix-turn-helix domain-containing protein n=1 Tax=Nocardioides sp. zg-DK7169 TaxID=2736600 RepID=UPI0015561802|nr:helix-turn-helix domain-containing protein [Nocardioides sp. zg-DK7169]